MKRGDRYLVGIDLESGGFEPGAHGILAIGGYWQNFSGRTHQFRILVEREPDTEVEPMAAAKCGWLSDEQWIRLGAVPLATALGLFEKWLSLLKAELGGATNERTGGRAPAPPFRFEPVAHNHAAVDCPFLEYWAEYFGRRDVLFGEEGLLSHAWHDSMTTLRAAQVAGLVPAEGGASLDAMLRHMGRRRVSKVHDAAEDAKACFDGYYWLTELMRRGKR